MYKSPRDRVHTQIPTQMWRETQDFAFVAVPWEFPSRPIAGLSALSLPRAWARSLVKELRSHKPDCAARKKPASPGVPTPPIQDHVLSSQVLRYLWLSIRFLELRVGVILRCLKVKTPGVGDGQGGPACCDSWGLKESDMTERLTKLNWTELKG